MNDGVHLIRMKNIVDGFKKLKNATKSNDAIDLMLQLKHETESYIGQYISIDDALEVVQKDLKKQGHKIDKKQLKEFKKKVEKRENKARNRALYLASIAETGAEFKGV